MAGKIILITGSTDGIGRETAKLLINEGHRVLVHGRSQDKLLSMAESLDLDPRESLFRADLANLQEVKALASVIAETHQHIDVLLNNAGDFSVKSPVLENGQDRRFLVNTLAPYLLTRELMPLLGEQSRVINVSSAAQAPVQEDALRGKVRLGDHAAYAQSKLALNMWSLALNAETRGKPSVLCVNPGSLLATKMVKKAFGMDGKDIQIGARILRDLAVHKRFARAGGRYFDNDKKAFADIHHAGQDLDAQDHLIHVMDELINR